MGRRIVEGARTHLEKIENSKITIGLASGLMFSIIVATWTVIHSFPSVDDVAAQDKRSDKIVSWVKEENAKEKADRIDGEKRLEASIARNQETLLREIGVLQGDVKAILRSLPRRTAAQGKWSVGGAL